jgi:hypothetical protein
MSNPSDIEKRFAERLKADFDQAESIKANQRADAEAAFTKLRPTLEALSSAVKTGNGSYGQISTSQRIHIDEYGNSELEIMLRRRDGRLKTIHVKYGPSLGAPWAYFVEGLSDEVANRIFPIVIDPFDRRIVKRSDRTIRVESQDVDRISTALEEDIMTFFLPNA